MNFTTQSISQHLLKESHSNTEFPVIAFNSLVPDTNGSPDHSNEASDTDHSNKSSAKTKLQKTLVGFGTPNEQQECGQLVKTQGSTGNFQTHLNLHGITKPTKAVEIIAQPTINKMFHCAAVEYFKTHLATEIKTCGLMCDLWTACSRSGYIDITCYFINSNYELKEGLSKKVISISTDNAANMVKAINLMDHVGQNCTPISMSINIEELDLMNMSTIFEEDEEDIVDVDKELKTIITANGGKFKLSQPQNTNSLVEKVKESLHIALNHYWDTPLDYSLIAMLLDPCCKSIRKLNSWECDKAVDLL
ncbi:36016_t:CDS:2 [Gigaspora margarita]|uniref:36016_t:CDS:1 n=1 Tax=Gigaspora margarita TaxID=4874 RepID=A0ABN7UDK9_GIGMA|nr:36016_t:CDS:2 [Gigaspora margarita]